MSRSGARILSVLCVWGFISFAVGAPGFAQELDLTPYKPQPKSGGITPASAIPSDPEPSPPGQVELPLTGGTPFSATITKSLYLPPAMYGFWSVTSHLTQTDTEGYFAASTRDIWNLEQAGNEVVISNPDNGASATIHVTEVSGSHAIFHRTGVAGKGKIYSETVDIVVHNDTLNGSMLSKLEVIKDGRVVRSVSGRYLVQAQRITEGRTKFIPPGASGNPDPDFTIEDIKPSER